MPPRRSFIARFDCPCTLARANTRAESRGARGARARTKKFANEFGRRKQLGISQPPKRTRPALSASAYCRGTTHPARPLPAPPTGIIVPRSRHGIGLHAINFPPRVETNLGTGTSEWKPGIDRRRIVKGILNFATRFLNFGPPSVPRGRVFPLTYRRVKHSLAGIPE